MARDIPNPQAIEPRQNAQQRQMQAAILPHNPF